MLTDRQRTGEEKRTFGWRVMAHVRKLVEAPVNRPLSSQSKSGTNWKISCGRQTGGLFLTKLMEECGWRYRVNRDKFLSPGLIRRKSQLTGKGPVQAPPDG